MKLLWSIIAIWQLTFRVTDTRENEAVVAVVIALLLSYYAYIKGFGQACCFATDTAVADDADGFAPQFLCPEERLMFFPGGPLPFLLPALDNREMVKPA
jgi:hypothetical protein